AKPQARMAISSAVIGCLSDLLYISAYQFQQLLLQLTLDAAELDLCLGAFFGALGLYLADLFKGADELLIGLLQRLNVHNAALGLLGDVNAALVELLGVGLEQAVRHVVDLALGLHGL